MDPMGWESKQNKLVNSPLIRPAISWETWHLRGVPLGKMVVGRRSCPGGKVTFQGRTVSFLLRGRSQMNHVFFQGILVIYL